jgi:hypothetical protein
MWDGGTIEDPEGVATSEEWIRLYDEMRSHAVISAFDFLGDIFKKAGAADERRHRPFVLTHAVPAALCILLHDWRIWRLAKKWKLFPVDASIIPMAALLIYLDTWDDYRRRGQEQRIFMRTYAVGRNGASVVVEWGDSEELQNEEIKYRAFKKALKNPPFSLKISARMASER